MKGGALGVLGLAAAGLAWLLASGGDASAKAGGTSDVSRRVAEALATEDPPTMRAVAMQLRLQGQAKAAEELERSATELEAERVAAMLPPAPSGIPSGAVLSPGWPSLPTAGPSPHDEPEEMAPPPEPAPRPAPAPAPAAPAPVDLVTILREAGIPIGGRENMQLPPGVGLPPGLDFPAAPAPSDGTPPEMAPQPSTSPPLHVPTLAQRLLAIGDPTPTAPLLKLTTPHTKGDAVKAWQLVLLALDPHSLPTYGADKDFGSETQKATSNAQNLINALYARAGLTPILVDAIVGPATRTGAARVLAVQEGMA